MTSAKIISLLGVALAASATAAFFGTITGLLLGAAGLGLAAVGYARALREKRSVAPGPLPDPYATGYEIGNEIAALSIDQLREMVRLAERRVEEMERRGWQGGVDAARGLLHGYQAALRRAEGR